MPVEPVTPVSRLNASTAAMAPARPPAIEKPSAWTPLSQVFMVPKNSAPATAPDPAASA